MRSSIAWMLAAFVLCSCNDVPNRRSERKNPDEKAPKERDGANPPAATAKNKTPAAKKAGSGRAGSGKARTAQRPAAGAKEKGKMPESDKTAKSKAGTFVQKTEAEWKKILTPMQFHVTRKKGTEYAYTGAYWNTKTKGIYACVCCGADLFSSETKYDSRTGWPSFWQPIDRDRLASTVDFNIGYARDEVVCKRCGAHLGHVFDDGPAPTGKRYCLNSASLRLEPADEKIETGEKSKKK